MHRTYAVITVVIPYFQRTPGVLAKALASIAAQQACPLPIHVIVVDDASPAPVGPELEMAPMPHTVQVIVQPNGGPGAARNTGLDNAPPGTRYIAFLDSDDEWTPDHLARAIFALSSGFDFYFADLYQLGQSTSAFVRAGRIEIAQHPLLPGLSANLHAYQGDLFDQIIRGNIIGTPTVVYDFRHFSEQRFRTEFTNAGEDYLFWMELAKKGAKVAFSSIPEVRCGKGVNVYSGSGWGSEQHLLRIHNEIKYRLTTVQLFPLNSAQQAHIDQAVASLRLSFARDLMHRVVHRKSMPWPLLKRHLMLDPRSFLALPVNLTRAVIFRARGT